MKKHLLLALCLSLALTGCTQEQVETQESSEPPQTEKTELDKDLEVGTNNELLIIQDELYASGDTLSLIDLSSETLEEKDLYTLSMNEEGNDKEVLITEEDYSDFDGRKIKDKDSILLLKENTLRIIRPEMEERIVELQLPEGVSLEDEGISVFTMNNKFVLVSLDEETIQYDFEGQEVQRFDLKATSASMDQKLLSYDPEEEQAIGFLFLDGEGPQLINLLEEGVTLLTDPFFYAGDRLLYLTEEEGQVVFNSLNVTELKASNIKMGSSENFVMAKLTNEEVLVQFNDQFYFGNEEHLSYYNESYDEIRRDGDTFAIKQGDNIRVIKEANYQDYSVEGSLLDYELYQGELIILYEIDGVSYLKEVSLEF